MSNHEGLALLLWRLEKLSALHLDLLMTVLEVIVQTSKTSKQKQPTSLRKETRINFLN